MQNLIALTEKPWSMHTPLWSTLQSEGTEAARTSSKTPRSDKLRLSCSLNSFSAADAPVAGASCSVAAAPTTWRDLPLQQLCLAAE